MAKMTSISVLNIVEEVKLELICIDQQRLDRGINKTFSQTHLTFFNSGTLPYLLNFKEKIGVYEGLQIINHIYNDVNSALGISEISTIRAVIELFRTGVNNTLLQVNVSYYMIDKRKINRSEQLSMATSWTIYPSQIDNDNAENLIFLVKKVLSDQPNISFL